MDDIRRNAEKRAANPSTAPAGTAFETERQKQKAALVRQLDELDPSRVRKISAYSETSETNKELRVAAYCRVSTDDIDQVISISLQMKQYKEKIQSNPNWKYAGTYVDNGFSGTNTAHRPGFLKLIEDARAGKFDMIITKAVSRFARNLLDCIGYIEELKSLDPPVRVFFEQENLDTGLQTSGIILFVLAMVAEEESHMKSEAMLLSLEWRFSRGRFMTPALFGYDKVEIKDEYGGKRKILQINQSQAQVVKWMYATLLNGGTTDEIAERLTELQIPTGGRRRIDGAVNTQWTGTGVASLMRNERYCGDVLARKTYTPNFKDHKSKKNKGKKNKYFQPDHHDAIVTRAIWNAAQRILNSRRYGHEGEYLPMRVIDRGVLTGAPVTDIRISLAAGRAHDKHTTGGDFREATYRAVRHALMQARAAGKAVLLEPWCEYEMEGGRFSVFGCGLCALANIYSSLTPYECSPVAMYRYAMQASDYSPSWGYGAIDWPYMGQTLRSLGFKVSFRKKDLNYETFRRAYRNSLTAIVLVCSEDDDTYWHDTPGHYVNPWLYDEETDMIFLGDSGNPDHNRSWVPLRYLYDAMAHDSSFQYMLVRTYKEDKNTWRYSGIEEVCNYPPFYKPKPRHEAER